jgi:hypothetical protein
MQSSIKETGERFDTGQEYNDLALYPTVDTLLRTAEVAKKPIHVLCWGSLTEPAILVSHCLSTGKTEILEKLRFIAHWTNSSLHQGTPEHPEHVANCREDARACAYMKEQAMAGKITYYECGAIGQHGIVSGAPKGDDYYDQFRVSTLGTIFVEGKYVREHVDHSDAATYWTLLGNWGVSLDDLPSDGTNTPEREKTNEEKYSKWSEKIHNELLRRAQLAAKR